MTRKQRHQKPFLWASSRLKMLSALLAMGCTAGLLGTLLLGFPSPSTDGGSSLSMMQQLLDFKAASFAKNTSRTASLPFYARLLNRTMTNSIGGLDLATTDGCVQFPLPSLLGGEQTFSSSAGSTNDSCFWPYDVVAPSIQSGRVLELDSIPLQHRLPPSIWTQIATDGAGLSPRPVPLRPPTNLLPHQLLSLSDLLMEYNPSLVKIPSSALLSREFPQAVYLASFRVSNQHYCFTPQLRDRISSLLSSKHASGTFDGSDPRHPYNTTVISNGRSTKTTAINWLGLALLDGHFNMLHNAVLDLKRAGFPWAEDFRLFSFHSQLYISSYDLISPLRLGSRPFITNTSTTTKASLQDATNPVNDIDFVQVPAVFGNLSVWVRRQAWCAPCQRERGVCGKNLNYFTAANASSNPNLHESFLAEIWPSPPHQVRAVQLGPCRRGLSVSSHVDDNPMPPEPSFRTIEQGYFPGKNIFTRGRGGACCIPIQDPTNSQRTLWVGIQHVKTPSQGSRRKDPPQPIPGGQPILPNHYLSSLYAFEQTPPYRIVARSGYFCWGFPSPNEHPKGQVTTLRKLILGRVVDKCPRIHFVSGMTLHAIDPTLVVITYGINDCLSRLIHVPVSEISRLLFGLASAHTTNSTATTAITSA